MRSSLTRKEEKDFEAINDSLEQSKINQLPNNLEPLNSSARSLLAELSELEGSLVSRIGEVEMSAIMFSP